MSAARNNLDLSAARNVRDRRRRGPRTSPPDPDIGSTVTSGTLTTDGSLLHLVGSNPADSLSTFSHQTRPYTVQSSRVPLSAIRVEGDTQQQRYPTVVTGSHANRSTATSSNVTVGRVTQEEILRRHGLSASTNATRGLMDQSQELSEEALSALKLAHRSSTKTTQALPDTVTSHTLSQSTISRTTTIPQLPPPLPAPVPQVQPSQPPSNPLRTVTETVPDQSSRDGSRIASTTAAATTTRISKMNDEWRLPATQPPAQARQPIPTPPEQVAEITILDATLSRLGRHRKFAQRLSMNHPHCIRVDSKPIRMRMVGQGTCPRVIGNVVDDAPTTVKACAISDITATTVVEFILEGRQWAYPVLCYGDLIALRQGNQSYLQVMARTKTSTLTDDVSVWELQMGPAQDVWNLWIVLPHGHDDLPLQVGWAATQKPVRPTGVPVHWGDPLVLRHLKTGGVLSLHLSHDYNKNKSKLGSLQESLRIVTDSLHSAGNLHPTSGTMDRLQRHDLLVPTRQEALWLELATVPMSLPTWEFPSQQRMFLTCEYLWYPERKNVSKESKERDKEQLGQEVLQEEDQVRRLVEELLGSFLGLEGSLVHRNPSQDFEKTYVVSGCDSNVSQLASTFVSLSNDVLVVRQFVAAQYPGYTNGRVRQALGGALDSCLGEYFKHISSIECRYRKENFGLHQLQLLIQPSRDCMQILRRVTEIAEQETGGTLLNALRRLRFKSFDGDAIGQLVLDRLLREATRPYFAMLHQWLSGGMLDDVHGEFMVQRSGEDSVQWEELFVVRPEHILEGFFSTTRVCDVVLPTGRYWQAIKSCQTDCTTKTDQMHDFELSYDASPAEIAGFINLQYRQASSHLLKLLLMDYDLIGVLKLIKRYFLLDQGDFFVNFMDQAEEHLCVPLDKLSVGRLQHTLSVAVQLTEHESEEAWLAYMSKSSEGCKLSPNELRCRLAKFSLIDRLDHLHKSTGGIDTQSPGTPQRRIYNKNGEDHQTGVDVFCIEFPRIPPPLSLILTPKNMDSYQLLFRSLFFAKHVERRLVSVWRDHLTLKELPSLRGSMGRTFLLRQRMLHCLQHVIYYMMFEVIEPNWTDLEKQIATAYPTDVGEQTVDDILALHSRFLEKTLEACLITSRQLLSSLMRLMRTCLLFADQMNLFIKSIGIHQDRHQLALEKQRLVQQGLHNREYTRTSNQKGLRESLRQDYLDRQRRVLEHTRRVEREVTVSTYTTMIGRHEEVFNQQLREFMNLLSQSDDLYHTQKVNLCLSLDYNGFSEKSVKA